MKANFWLEKVEFKQEETHSLFTMAVQLTIAPLLDGTVAVQVKVRNPRKPRVAVTSLKESYTAEEVAAMDIAETLAEWIRITGHKTLGCKHCGKTKEGAPKAHPVADRWMSTIHRHCSRYGLRTDMNLPGTCDKQRGANTLKNKVDNPYYNRLNSVKPLTDEERAALKKEHDEAKRALGIKPRAKKTP